jgi:O-antigen/teichoic acid export membrane protein
VSERASTGASASTTDPDPSRGRGLLRNAGIYGISQLASRALPFLLLPVLTRYLTPAEYGIVTMFLLVIVLIEPFVLLGLNGAITVKFFDRSVDLPAFIGTGFGVVGVAAAVAFLLVLIAGPAIEAATLVPVPWLLVAVLVVVARTVVNAGLELLRVQERAGAYGLVLNVQSIALAALAVFLVVAVGLGWPGRAAAEVIAWVGLALLSAFLLLRSGSVRRAFDRRYARDLLVFGVPLIPHTLGAVVMVQAERAIITNSVGVDQTGLYTVGYQLGAVIQLAAMAFNSAYAPWLYRHLANPGGLSRRQLVRLSYGAGLSLVVLAMTVALAVPAFGGILLGPEFEGATAYMGWLSVGFLFSGLYFLVTNYIFFAKKTGWLAAVTIATAIGHVGLVSILVPMQGALGAAEAMAVSFAVRFGLTWWVSARVYPMPWRTALVAERSGE